MPHRMWVLLAALFLALGASACGGDDSGGGKRAGTAEAAAAPGMGKPPVRIGTKNFTEQYVVGELYAQALRAKGWTVELKSDIGSSEVADKALTSGVIDLYPEYTGTALSVVKGQTEVPMTADETYDQAKAFYEGRGQTLLARSPFEDRDAVAVTRAFGETHDLRTPADLGPLGARVTLGAAPEFRTRFAGLVGLREEYGLHEMRFHAMPIEEVLGALDDGRIQAADVFTTDARLASGNYVVLEDPKAIFGFQNLVPVVAQSTVREQGPAFADTLNAVTVRLTTDVMRQMNAAVDLDGESPADVAERFLQSTVR